MRRGPELPVMALKHSKTAIALSRAQNPASGVGHHARSLEHQLLHHCLDAPTLGRVTHRRIGLVEHVLPNQAQQIHRHRGQLAYQVVGVKLAIGQALQIHVRFELRMKLLMRGVVGVQCNDLRRVKASWQDRHPVLQHILGHQQGVAMLVTGALGQPGNPARRIGWTAHAGQIQRLLPQAFALAWESACPGYSCISHFLCGMRLHGCRARVPLKDEGYLARQVVLALLGRMLHPGVQRQLQAVTQSTQIDGKRAIAIAPRVGTPVQLFLGAPVVHGKGVQIDGGLAAGQRTEVYGLAAWAAAQQRAVDLSGKFEPVTGVGIHAMAQGGTGRHGAQAQGAHEEGVAAEILDRIKVVLAQVRQAQVALEDIAVGNAGVNREGRIDQRVGLNLFEILSQRRSDRRGN